MKFAFLVICSLVGSTAFSADCSFINGQYREKEYGTIIELATNARTSTMRIRYSVQVVERETLSIGDYIVDGTEHQNQPPFIGIFYTARCSNDTLTLDQHDGFTRNVTDYHRTAEGIVVVTHDGTTETSRLTYFTMP